MRISFCRVCFWLCGLISGGFTPDGFPRFVLLPFRLFGFEVRFRIRCALGFFRVHDRFDLRDGEFASFVVFLFDVGVHCRVLVWFSARRGALRWSQASAALESAQAFFQSIFSRA